MLSGAGAPLGKPPCGFRSRPAFASRVRGYHKELPSRFDPALLVQELREAAEG